METGGGGGRREAKSVLCKAMGEPSIINSRIFFRGEETFKLKDSEARRKGKRVCRPGILICFTRKDEGKVPRGKRQVGHEKTVGMEGGETMQRKRVAGKFGIGSQADLRQEGRITQVMRKFS